MRPRWRGRSGHLAPGDVLQNLATGLETGKLQGGETVLAINNSSAAAWSSALLRA